jgi:hypothetical protein
VKIYFFCITSFLSLPSLGIKVSPFKNMTHEEIIDSTVEHIIHSNNILNCGIFIFFLKRHPFGLNVFCLV